MDILKRIIRRAIANTPKSEVPEHLILNEAVNFERECIFIAVPKTGTMSIRS